MYSLEDDDIYIRNLDHIKHILADNKGVFCCPSNKTCAYYCIYFHNACKFCAVFIPCEISRYLFLSCTFSVCNIALLFYSSFALRHLCVFAQI